MFSSALPFIFTALAVGAQAASDCYQYASRSDDAASNFIYEDLDGTWQWKSNTFGFYGTTVKADNYVNFGNQALVSVCCTYKDGHSGCVDKTNGNQCNFPSQDIDNCWGYSTYH
ncbi:hypothetical protein SLS56_009425 [Neofusicoccum ribis]